MSHFTMNLLLSNYTYIFRIVARNKLFSYDTVCSSVRNYEITKPIAQDVLCPGVSLCSTC